MIKKLIFSLGNHLRVIKSIIKMFLSSFLITLSFGGKYKSSNINGLQISITKKWRSVRIKVTQLRRNVSQLRKNVKVYEKYQGDIWD
ncbi:hypothetical protein [Clostridium pasteurianum]|uniref:hypothetical protein n=1 Tax=Clostridium pasteurianum TaxID=1501 RepID=UPI001586E849|nr:hypothetical protein [Clostridium pasteurianum]